MNDYILTFLFFIGIGLVIVLFSIAVSHAADVNDNRHDDKLIFQGKCEQAGGKVEGNLCLQGNTVILRRK